MIYLSSKTPDYPLVDDAFIAGHYVRVLRMRITISQQVYKP